MVLLAFDVFQQRLKLGLTEREGAVAGLPFEVRTDTGLILQPDGTGLFYPLHKFRDADRSREVYREMDMVSNPADAENVATHVSSDGGEVGEEARADLGC